MKLTTENIDNIIVVTLDGHIALDGTTQLRDFIKPLIEENAGCDFIMDMPAVTTIDSSGIGLIVQIYKLINQNEHRLILTGLNDKCTEIFALTQLNKILTLLKSKEEALAFLK